MPSSSNTDHDGRYYTEDEIDALVALVDLDAVLAIGDTSATHSITLTNGTLTANTITDGTFSVTGGVITGATNTNWDLAYAHIGESGGSHSLLQADAGTASANKALIVDSNLDIDLATGDLSATDITVTGKISIGVGKSYEINSATFLNNVGTNVLRLGIGAGTNNTGDDCIFLGADAGGDSATGNGNTCIGYQTGYDLTSGRHNFLAGTGAGANITTGTGNTAIGNYALNSASDKWGNIAIGFSALRHFNSHYNLAIGYQAMGFAAGSGQYNSVIGYWAGAYLTTGGSNVLVGYQVGDNLTTGGTNIIIGSDINASAVGVDNELNIGNVIFGDMTSGVQIGDGLTNTNYTKISNEGVMTFHGNARFWQGVFVSPSRFKEPTSGIPPEVNRGLGTARDFSDNKDTEHLHAVVSIPGFWDATENLEVILHWESPATSLKCDWYIKYQLLAENEDMTSTTTTTLGGADGYFTSSATANGLVHSTIIIPTAAFDAGDKKLRFELWRDADNANGDDTLGDSAYLHGIRIRGVRNKTGGALT